MKGHFAGGKMAGSHTTAIDCACRLIEAISAHQSVGKISLGVISAHPCTGGRTKVKVSCGDGYTLLAISQKGSVQEVRVYPVNGKLQEMNLAICREVRNLGLELCFKEI